jgi:hypothetical protein
MRSLLEKLFISYSYFTVSQLQLCLRNAKSTSLKTAAPFKLTYLPQPAGLKNAQDEVNDIRTP